MARITLIAQLKLPVHLILLIVLGLSAVACAPQDELHGELHPRLLERLEAYRSEEPFPRAFELEECFADGAHCLMGYTVELYRERLELELVYHSKQALSKKHRPIARLINAADGERLEDVSHQGIVRELYPPARWRSGEWIRERLSIPLSKAHSASRDAEVALELGFARPRSWLSRLFGQQGADEELVTLPVEELLRLGNDSKRVEMADAEGARLRPLPRPRLIAKRASVAPTIDGALDEASWNDAEIFSDFRHPMTGLETRASGRVRLLFDDEALYLGAEIDDHDLQTEFRERDDPLWEADVFELFLMPIRGAEDYLEIQISPRGIIFDSHFERRRRPSPHGHIEFDAELEVAVIASGSFGDRRPDEGYTIEARIPYRAIKRRLEAFEAPTHGSMMRANFFILDRGRGYHSAAAASPPLVPDFHYTPAFARLAFLD